MGFKMTEIVEFKGGLRVLESGLRIGGAKDAGIGIGETDNPIIRHPITRLPYVPGSSVKGKIRSLLESKYCQQTQRDGRPCKCGECVICQLFGSGNPGNIYSPSRLVFRDSQPTAKTQTAWEEAGTTSEVKTEVLIDRNKGSARSNIGPRTMERIPAGSEFNFLFSLRCFEGDKLKDYYGYLAEGFELLHKHYLGGAGSRGYGHVLIVADDGTPMHEHLKKLAAQAK